MLLAVGSYELALEPIDEAILLSQEILGANLPGRTHEIALQTYHSLLLNRLKALGSPPPEANRQQALETAAELTRIGRLIADLGGDLGRRALVRSLLSETSCLLMVGGHDEAALSVAEEALELTREAGSLPAEEDIVDLANAESNFAQAMHTLGESEGCVSAAQTAQRLWTDLVERYGDRHFNSWAAATFNYAVECRSHGEIHIATETLSRLNSAFAAHPFDEMALPFRVQTMLAFSQLLREAGDDQQATEVEGEARLLARRRSDI